MATQIQPSDAGDRCPYPRPFPREFSGCPSYQAVTFAAADSSNRPLGTYLTCRHLASGRNRDEPGGFYPRCSLGSGADRLGWLATVGPARQEVVRALQEEFDSFSAPLREGLRRAKAELLDAPRPARPGSQLDQLVNAYLGAVEAFVEERRRRLEEVGLPVAPVLRLIEASTWAWARSRDLGSAPLGERSLEAFTPTVQAFLGAPAAAPWQARPTGEVIYDQGLLRISRRPDERGLRLDGAIDASNVDALSGALEAAVQGAGDVYVDLGGVLFCDVGGIRALVRAAEMLAGRGQLVLELVPEQVQRTMRAAGWSSVSGVVIANARPADAGPARNRA
jgi:anti-anti-sigma factor